MSEHEHDTGWERVNIYQRCITDDTPRVGTTLSSDARVADAVPVMRATPTLRRRQAEGLAR